MGSIAWNKQFQNFLLATEGVSNFFFFPWITGDIRQCIHCLRNCTVSTALQQLLRGVEWEWSSWKLSAGSWTPAAGGTIVSSNCRWGDYLPPVVQRLRQVKAPISSWSCTEPRESRSAWMLYQPSPWPVKSSGEVFTESSHTVTCLCERTMWRLKEYHSSWLHG